MRDRWAITGKMASVRSGRKLAVLVLGAVFVAISHFQTRAWAEPADGERPRRPSMPATTALGSRW